MIRAGFNFSASTVTWRIRWGRSSAPGKVARQHDCVAADLGANTWEWSWAMRAPDAAATRMGESG